MKRQSSFTDKLLRQNLPDDKALHLDNSFKYEDSFYEEYIRNFVPGKKPNLAYRIIKRLFDIVVSFLALSVLIIPFGIISIAICLDSKGSPIFKNRRVGKDGKIFNCLKFRTMANDAPHEVATVVFSNADSYITKVGRWLRKTSIDELPQLFNVLAGQMSIIGYRPLVPTEEKCNQMRQQLHVFSMTPGISGLAQVSGRDDVYYKNKALLDSYYVKNASFKMDFSIIWESIYVTLTGDSNWDSHESGRDK